MACANCKCDPTPEKDFPASGTELDGLKKSVEKLTKEVSAINRFLDHKYHNDLYPGGTCGVWWIDQERKMEREQHILESIHQLKFLGYVITEPNA